jgi:hypothetical protein
MKKLFSFILVLISLHSFAQDTIRQIPKAIKDYPRYAAPLDTAGYLPISINNATRSIDVSNINRGRIDSVKNGLKDTAAAHRALIAGKANQQALNDTAAAHRALIANINTTGSTGGLSQQTLNDTAAAHRSLINSNTASIASNTASIATKANQQALVDTAAAHRSLINSNTASIASNTASIATKANQQALVDTAAAHRLLINNVANSNTGDETGATIVQKLGALTGVNRLDASAIKNLPSAGGGSSMLHGWFDVTAYGAIGDSVTDDRAAIIAARDAAYLAGGGILFFPAGKFRISDSVLFNHSIRIVGITKSGGLVNSQNGGVDERDRLGPVEATTIIYVPDGKNGFVIDRSAGELKPNVVIEYLTMRSTVAAGTNTSGAFIKIKGMNQDADISNITFYGGWIQIEVESAFYQRISKCHFSAPAKAGIKTGNIIRTDTGDFSIDNCKFSSGPFNTATNGTVGIWWYSGGGMRVINCKFDASEYGVNHAFVYDIYAENTLDATSVIHINDNSLENWGINAIRIQGNVSPYIRHIMITSNTFAAVGSTGSAIYVDHMEDVLINNFECRDWSGSVAASAITATNCSGLVIGKGIIQNYTSNLNYAGSTRKNIDYTWMPSTTGQFWSSDLVWATPSGGSGGGTTTTHVLLDSFNRADNASSLGNLQTPSTLAWTANVGTWGVSSNKAYCASAITSGSTTLNYVTADAGISNYAFQVEMTKTAGSAISETELVFRYSDASNYWIADITSNAGAPSITLYKKVAGAAYEQVGTVYSAATAEGTHTFKVVTSGSSIIVYRDGASIITVTDGFNSTATKVGIGVFQGAGYVGNTDRFDNVVLD